MTNNKAQNQFTDKWADSGRAGGHASYVVGMQKGALPFTYLGLLPLRENYKSKFFWDGAEKKLRKWAMWEKQYTTKGGSTLSSLPVSMISIFIIPKLVAIQLQRSSLCGNKMHKGSLIC